MIKGIISGLAVVGIIWLAKLVWQYVISPIIQGLTYHGVKIEGEWITELGDQQLLPYREKVILKRHGTTVEGTIECIESGPTKEDLGKKYEFISHFKNNFLICIYSIAEEALMDIGCFGLHLTGEGNALEGYCISYHHPAATLRPLGYVWRKQATR